jgi:nucleotide-binding universal stress UspA family protein
MKWQTILVPHDFSESANHAARIAREEASARGGKIILVHVIELPHQLDAASMVSDGEGRLVPLQEYASARASVRLQELADQMTSDGVPTSAVIAVGTPAEEIHRACTDHGADVIVMGTHGRTGIRKLIAGSVAERVVRSATVPVLTIRHPGE